ncbi:MAG: DUF255 domain-containing protein [Campylobacterota bacterium]|nr:DUF255 domain-containing protein [Campylobacterota bacterium]
MRKILIYITLLFATTAMAANISWAKDYESGMKLAKAQNKPVLFVVSRDTCKFCVILKDTTFKDKTVVKALDRDYISIIAQIDENDYVPKELYAPGLPTIWFLLPDGRPMFQPLMGMVKSKDFLDALAIVKSEFDTLNKGVKAK